MKYSSKNLQPMTAGAGLKIFHPALAVELPFVAFVLFGVYSIVSIIRGVCSLKDRPEEVERLRRLLIVERLSLFNT
uniref:Dolichol-phosphate mannosyltransferase subunit 3 n=1 Tax=Romanomermis culicivorax TaxID=13658 RepID=A0A915IVI2_ROMCU